MSVLKFWCFKTVVEVLLLATQAKMVDAIWLEMIQFDTYKSTSFLLFVPFCTHDSSPKSIRIVVEKLTPRLLFP